MKITNLLFALSLLMVISCGKDEEPETESPMENSIVGEWELVSFELTSETKSDLFGIESTTEVVVTDEDPNYLLTFDEDSYTAAGSYIANSVVFLDGAELSTQSDSYTDVNGGGSYTLSGTTMMIKGVIFDLKVNGMDVIAADEEQEATIEKLDATDLIVTQSLEQVQDLSGISTNFTINSRSEWKRK